ncbi:MAG: hypothetical protein NZ700_03095 [Gemmataceae bacterium]|nr:hypothetical protein [Gemmataceae bacterium]MDW8265916.1 hypothetical protein [Gemmataceae bacterium]
MAKKFDFRQFLLARGEKVGIGIAVGITLLVTALGGYTAFTSPSPESVSAEIFERARAVRQRIYEGAATSADSIRSDLNEPVRNVQLPPDAFPQRALPFMPRGIEDAKRRNPDVLVPVEVQIDVIRAPVRWYDVISEGGRLKVGILVPRGTPAINERKAEPTARQKRLAQQMEYLARLYQARGLPPPIMPSPTQQARLAEAATDNTVKYELRHVPVGDVGENPKFAEIMYPVRMVIVAMSFPYKEQLESFRRALRLPTIEALMAERDAIPSFIGLHVQRRVVKPGLKPEEGWEDLDVGKDNTQWVSYRALLSRSISVEKENPKLEKLIPNRQVVMPRPVLGREERYPDLNLATIASTLDALEKTGKGAALKTSPLASKLLGEKDPFAAPEPEDREPAPQMTPAPESKTEGTVIPGHCLLRFIDVTVRPGMTYEYRVQARMANPNLDKRDLVAYPYLAEVKELASPWYVIPKPVTIESELAYYAVNDQKVGLALGDADRVLVQMHRWLEVARLNPAYRDTETPIADWAIHDVPAHRGEHIGRLVDGVKVLMWYPTRETFDLAINPASLKTSRPRGAPLPRGIPVDFSTKDILVDFEGGKGTSVTVKSGDRTRNVTDDAEVEMLILTAEGKLVVRTTTRDSQNEERSNRFREWNDKVKDAEQRAASGGSGKSPFDTKKDPFMQ